MMLFKKAGLPLLIFLVIYWMIVIFLIVLLSSFCIAFIFYLKNSNDFYFDFFNESIYSLSKAVPGGSVLGVGIWIKARLQARKDQ